VGILDDLKAVTNLGGSATGEQHANTLSAIMEYINSPQVGGISGLQQKFQERWAGQFLDWQRSKPADLGR